MLKLIFKGIRIENRTRFLVFVCLYAVTFLVFAFLCTVEGIMSFRIEDIPGIFLLFPGMSYAVYHGPTVAIAYGVISFFEILLIAWQTNLKGQRLNRFVLFFLAVNLLMTVIGLTIGQGLVITLIVVVGLLLMLVLPTVIVIKVKEKNGTYDYSDILTPEEYEEYKSRKKQDSA